MQLNPAHRRSLPSGFTLVEILIVVIILGILAAIVIPAFASASGDARKSSLMKQLQTVRSQIGLYNMEHNDSASPQLIAGGATAWGDMTIKTAADHTTTNAKLGPYLMGAPINQMNGLSTVTVVSGSTDYGTGGVAAPGGAGGWVFNSTTNKLWATSTARNYIFNERDINDIKNTQ